MLVLAIVGALAIAGAVLALRLEPDAGTGTLVSHNSKSFQATERFKKTFGDDAVIVLVQGNLQKTVLTSDLGRLLRLEGCLSGNVPKAGLKDLPAECTWFAQHKPAKVVYGPGTFVNTAAARLSEGFTQRQQQEQQAADAAAKIARQKAAKQGLSAAGQKKAADDARAAVEQQFKLSILKLVLRYGITSVPALDNPEFVSQLVFDPSRGVGQPKARFAYLFPSSNSAVVQVRFKPGLSDSERSAAIAKVRQAARASQFKLQNGGRYVVTGVPVVVDGLATAVKHSIFILLAAAIVVMAGTLALVFRSRLRLLPLAVALVAAALTFGAVSLAGGSLTMASIAVLPVLIGLSVDYAIQFQARYDEARLEGRPPEEAAPAAAAAGGPTIATAGLATAVGFLVLLLSPVPMVRGFGAMLVLGIVIAFACALTAGFAALVRFQDGSPGALPGLRDRASAAGERIADTRAWSWLAHHGHRGRELALDRGIRIVATSIRRPRAVLGAALAIAVLGWAADTQTHVISDVRELVPQNLQALKDVNTLQKETGVSGEIDVVLTGDKLATPQVIDWMTRFQSGVLQAHGWTTGATCAQRKNPPEICPALSLPDLFRSGGVTSQAQIDGLLQAVPRYFSQAVISPDQKTATLAFGIRLMPLDRQKQVIDDIERRLDPPAGVQASVAGLPVLAAEANSALSSTARRALTLLAGLVAVFLVLLIVRRRLRLATIPLIPIALATGWSALVLFLLRIPLNPMSATMGALVIAISTEFSVLLSSRYEEERRAGAAPARALELTYASTGAAVLASGVTAIAGFAALIASDIRMLRDFGIVTVVDLTLALLGVLVVLPAALVWAEQHGKFTLSDIDPRRGVRALRDAVRRRRARGGTALPARRA